MTVTLANAIRDGLHRGLNRSQYESIEAVNYSTLKHFGRSPAHARAMMLHPPAPTAAMEFGTAVHCAVMEPTRFAEEYVAAPRCDRRTKVGKETWKEFEESNEGKSILTAADALALKSIQEAVWNHPLARELLSGEGVNELTAVWTDEPTGRRCKAMLDRFTKSAGWSIVMDLKTCNDASERAFANHVVRYSYHEQAAYYLSGLAVLSPQRRRFIWLAVESEPPHGIGLYEPDADMLMEGARLWREHLDVYATCQTENIWPGYDTGIQSLKLPRWAQGGSDGFE